MLEAIDMHTCVLFQQWGMENWEKGTVTIKGQVALHNNQSEIDLSFKYKWILVFLKANKVNNLGFRWVSGVLKEFLDIYMHTHTLKGTAVILVLVMLQLCVVCALMFILIFLLAPLSIFSLFFGKKNKTSFLCFE